MSVRVTIAAALLAASQLATAAGGAIALMDANVDIGDRAALQNGARLFVNYCLGCHSMEYMRYKRMGEDLGLTDEQVAENLLLGADKVVAPMDSAMRREEAERWFGVAPPDLSVIARSRGADWLYSYLNTFYRDDNPSRPFGVNNVVFAGAAMPHVLWDLQGHQEYRAAEIDGNVVSEAVTRVAPAGDETLVHRSVTVERDGKTEVENVIDRLAVTIPGSMSAGEYRGAVRDLVTFLVYAGEPAQLKRYGLGLWTLAFLAVFFVLARMLYKEYWKDVH